MIEALVAIRIVLTFGLQQIGVIILRIRKPELFRPFRMWVYPAPALLALAGSIFVLTARGACGTAIVGDARDRQSRERRLTRSVPAFAVNGRSKPSYW